MPALATTNPTLVDLAKRLDPNGAIADIAEILNLTNEVLDDVPWVEGNLPTGYRTTIRSGLPAPTWRKLYGGVQPNRSQTTQVTENCGMLEAMAEIDKALADLAGNAAAFRMSEDKAFIEGMGQEFATALFYANEGATPEKFMGFAPRFNSLSAANADNIVDAGGTGSDNASVWLIGWDPIKVHGIYPKGSKVGLQQQDFGTSVIEDVDGAGGRMVAYRTHYRWDVGLCVRDWRYVVRIANIDVSDLTSTAATGADLLDLIARAFELPPSLSSCKPVLYCNRKIRSFLRRQQKNSKNVQITMEQVAGKHVTMLDGVPVKRCDALVETEARVV